MTHYGVNFKMNVIMGDFFTKIFNVPNDIFKSLSNSDFFFIDGAR